MHNGILENYGALRKELLEAGADVNAPVGDWNSYGGLALIDASTQGHLDIMKLLLDKGAKIDDDRFDVKGYFGVDGWFGFGAAFGFLSCLAMVLFAKGLGIFLKRKDSYYDE